MLDSKARVPVADLYDAYKKWEEGYPLSGKVFGNRLRKLGLEQHRTTGGRRIWKGVRLLSDDSDGSDGLSGKVPVLGEGRSLLKRSSLPPRPSLTPVGEGFWRGPVDRVALDQALSDLEGLSEADLDALGMAECESTGRD